jgi:hypothetical protein
MATENRQLDVLLPVLSLAHGLRQGKPTCGFARWLGLFTLTIWQCLYRRVVGSQCYVYSTIPGAVGNLNRRWFHQPCMLSKMTLLWISPVDYCPQSQVSSQHQLKFTNNRQGFLIKVRLITIIVNRVKCEGSADLQEISHRCPRFGCLWLVSDGNSARKSCCCW